MAERTAKQAHAACSLADTPPGDERWRVHARADLLGDLDLFDDLFRVTIRRGTRGSLYLCISRW